MNIRSLTVAAALAYPLTLAFYGCAAFAAYGPETPDGCRDAAAVYVEDPREETIDCHANATKIIAVVDGFEMHVCKCFVKDLPGQPFPP